MKSVIFYYSRHHGNTLKVLQSMAQGSDLDLIDVTTRQTVDLKIYDCIGLAASGIYGFELQPAVSQFARQFLPEKTPIFSVYTHSLYKGVSANALIKIAREKMSSARTILL